VAPIDLHLSQDRASVGHVLAAAFVSGVVALIAAASYLCLAGWAQGLGPLRFPSHLLLFAPILGSLSLFFVTPVHWFATRFLVSFIGSIARLAYLLPIILVALFPFVLSSGLTTSSTPFDSQALAITIATGVPAALAFHFTVYRKSQPAGSWMLALTAALWLAALVVGQFGVPSPQRVPSSPLATRDHVLIAWYQVGSVAILASGLAGFAIWHAGATRLAAGALLAGIVLPLSFAGWYFSVPLGDGYARFDLGQRIVHIDSKREPYTYDGGLNFSIADLEPYQNAGRAQINKTLRVKPAVGPLHNDQIYGKLLAPAREQWGLVCYDIDFRGRSITLCGQPGLPESWTSEILIEKGYVFIQFDRNGVRYGLHCDVKDAPNWRLIQQAAVRALDTADMNKK
jgi:hypothetical protein